MRSDRAGAWGETGAGAGPAPPRRPRPGYGRMAAGGRASRACRRGDEAWPQQAKAAGPPRGAADAAPASQPGSRRPAPVLERSWRSTAGKYCLRSREAIGSHVAEEPMAGGRYGVGGGAACFRWRVG